MKRCFLAVAYEDYYCREIEELVCTLREKSARVKWVDPKAIHLTLHYFGNLSEEQVSTLDVPLEKVCATLPSIRIGLEGLGCFPNAQRPRVIWAGLKGETDKLIRMQHEIADCLRGLGHRVEERQFVPHVTVGRVKDVRKLQDLAMGVAKTHFSPEQLVHVKNIILFESILTPQGARYLPIKSYVLDNK